MPTQAKIPTKPKGFNAINAMISVANVSDAIAFYADTLGAEPVETLVIPDTDIAIYATLKISGTSLVLNRDETALAETGSGPVTLHHYLDNIDECIERAVNNGVHVVSPITPTWWGDLNAVVIDPFGVRWSIAQRAKHLSSDQRKKRFDDLYAFARDDIDQVATPTPEIEAPLGS
jgi:PhnB protein